MTSRMVEPLVKIADGLLRGRVLQSVRGGSYFSFQGIPYAQPPVGPLRFKAPQQVKPWEGEREALKEGPLSPSFFLGTTQYQEGCSEDCLYLNVYTKKLPENRESNKPVMVWIHGGAFSGGSGNSDSYGPDYLVRHDIVLITINYRLGALGFLSLQNEACPGNNGLKDQVEALRWVRRNVAAFGGDPANVTIFGESAGGASVQYHLMSPTTQGLFHRAITQSGSVLNPWAASRVPVESAFKLGELLGCVTDSKEELLEFLKTVPERLIVEKTTKVLREVEPENFYLSNPFNPVVEPDLPDAFLAESPEKLLKEGRIHDVPYMLGVNTLEGIIISSKGLPPLNTTEELKRLLPLHPNLKSGTPLSNRIVEKIRSYYFPNGYNEQSCADILSAVHFLVGNDVVINAIGNATHRQSKTYFYYFTYDGGCSIVKQLTGYQNWKGTIHADDLWYLFYANMFKPEVEPGSKNDQMIDTFGKLWTNFATHGNPTHDTKLWPEYTSTDKSYLEIGEELTCAKDFKAQEMQFWSSIFAEIDGLSNPKL